MGRRHLASGTLSIEKTVQRVFPSELGTPIEPRNLNRRFARLRLTAGLPNVRLHDLRRTVVWSLMDLGVPPHIVQVIARHSDAKITLKIYAHANLAEMRSAFGQARRAAQLRALLSR